VSEEALWIKNNALTQEIKALFQKEKRICLGPIRFLHLVVLRAPVFQAVNKVTANRSQTISNCIITITPDVHNLVQFLFVFM
jgi:hypothetical protein